MMLIQTNTVQMYDIISDYWFHMMCKIRVLILNYYDFINSTASINSVHALLKNNVFLSVDHHDVE